MRTPREARCARGDGAAQMPGVLCLCRVSKPVATRGESLGGRLKVSSGVVLVSCCDGFVVAVGWSRGSETRNSVGDLDAFDMWARGKQGLRVRNCRENYRESMVFSEDRPFLRRTKAFHGTENNVYCKDPPSLISVSPF